MTLHGKYKAGRIARARRLSSGLAFAYLFFLCFPHFEAVSHVHDNGGKAHHHAFLSAHDVALERAALAAVPQGVPNGETAGTPAPPKTAPLPFDDGEGGHRLTGTAAAAHTHVQDDPNLPALGMDPVSPGGMLTALPAPGTVPSFVPALAILASPARAPPRG